MTAPLYLSVREAAQRIGINPETYRRHAAKGLLPVTRVMGRLVVPVKVLDEHMERLARESIGQVS